MEIKNYKVGGHTFSVMLEAPWHFMQYTEPVQSRINFAAAGKEPDIKPIRAGDNVPARTFVRNREELPEKNGQKYFGFFAIRAIPNRRKS